MSIPAYRSYLHCVMAYFENGNIKSSSAEIINNNLLVLFLVKSVSKRGRGRLGKNASHIKAGDLASGFSRRSLRIVKIRWHRNYGLAYLLSSLGFGVFFLFLQNHRGDFFWAIPFLVHLYFNPSVCRLSED